MLYIVLGTQLRDSLATWRCCVLVRAGAGGWKVGWRCRFKSNLGEDTEGSKRCGRRICMLSGVPCMAVHVVNYSERASVVGVLWKTCLP